MYGKKNQRKRGFRRVMVTLLSLTLLLGICMPGLYVSAEGEADLTLEVGQTKDLQGTSVVEGVPAVDHSWAIVEGADYITIAPQGDDAVVSVTANASGEATLNHTYYLTDSSDSFTEFFTVKVNSATNTDTDTDPNTDADTDPNTDADTDPNTDADTDPNTDSNIGGKATVNVNFSYTLNGEPQPEGNDVSYQILDKNNTAVIPTGNSFAVELGEAYTIALNVPENYTVANTTITGSQDLIEDAANGIIKADLAGTYELDILTECTQVVSQDAPTVTLDIVQEFTGLEGTGVTQDKITYAIAKTNAPDVPVAVTNGVADLVPGEYSVTVTAPEADGYTVASSLILNEEPLEAMTFTIPDDAGEDAVYKLLIKTGYASEPNRNNALPLAAEKTIEVGEEITLEGTEGNWYTSHTWAITSGDAVTLGDDKNSASCAVTGVKEGTATVTHTIRTPGGAQSDTEEFTITVTASTSIRHSAELIVGETIVIDDVDTSKGVTASNSNYVSGVIDDSTSTLIITAVNNSDNAYTVTYYNKDGQKVIYSVTPIRKGNDTELDAERYNSDSRVYWDTMIPGGRYSSCYVGDGEPEGMKVNLGGVTVNHGNSNETRWSGGASISAYYPDAKGGRNPSLDHADLVITPPTGYYVSKVVVACTGGGSEVPHNCRTWHAGNAYDKGFIYSGSTTFTIRGLSSLNFSHTSKSPNYFILIELAPIPTPLYVEYDPGYFGSQAAAAANPDVFNSPTDWTGTSTSGNEYGTGGEILTPDVQYKYVYPEGNPDNVSTWKHYANTITEAAINAAAALGYRFAGWKVEYYKTCDESQNPTYPGNLDFDEYYTTNTTWYKQNDNIPLIMNARVIAQWEPIPVTEDTAFIRVQKTFAGLDQTDIETIKDTFKIIVKDSSNRENTLTLNAYESCSTDDAGNITYTWKLSNLESGTYTVKEYYYTVTGKDFIAADTTNVISGYVTDESGATVVISGKNVTVSSSDKNITSCASEVFDFNKNTVMAISLTSNVTVFVSYQPLSASQRSAMITAHNDWSGSWNANKNFEFYSISTLGKVFTLHGATVTMDSATDPTKLTIGATSDWSMVRFATIENIDATNADVSVINYYASSDVNLTINKTVKGNLGELDKEFSFTAEILTDGMTFPAPAANDGYTVGDDGIALFELKHGSSVTLKVPVGAEIQITETNADGYEITWNENTEGQTYSVTTAANTNVEVSCVNYKQATINTGISLDTLPFLMMLTICLAGGCLLVFKRRNHRSY